MSPHESSAPLALQWLRASFVVDVLGSIAVWSFTRIVGAFDTYGDSCQGLIHRCSAAVFHAAVFVWELAIEQLDHLCSWDYDENDEVGNFEFLSDIGGFGGVGTFAHVSYKKDSSEELAFASTGLISFCPGLFVDDELAARLEDAATSKSATPRVARSCLRTSGLSHRTRGSRRVRWAEVKAGDVQEYHVACATAFRSVASAAAVRKGNERELDLRRTAQSLTSRERWRPTWDLHGGPRFVHEPHARVARDLGIIFRRTKP